MEQAHSEMSESRFQSRISKKKTASFARKLAVVVSSLGLSTEVVLAGRTSRAWRVGPLPGTSEVIGYLLSRT